MAKKKLAAEHQFPPECCGCCKFAHADTKNTLECFASSPQFILEDDGMVSAVRSAAVDPLDHICYKFKPKEHS